MADHTPGPWEWRSDYRLYGGGVPIAELYRDSPDARLIAAAPDLLAALVALCEGGPLPDLNDKRWAQATAAIDKARGTEA